MFSTFTGNSRRPRNVNLSGQRSTAVGPFGASKTVSHAQAERYQRQLERLRQAASKTIQRTWRGHRTRQSLRKSRRAAFDELYSSRDCAPSWPVTALPLILYFFDSRDLGDVRRLTMLTKDIESSSLSGGDTFRPVLPKIGHILVAALETQVSTSHERDLFDTETLLRFIIKLLREAPLPLCSTLDRYYKVLVILCKRQDLSSELVVEAILAPLVHSSKNGALSSPTLKEDRETTLYLACLDFAYTSFALTLLTEPNLPVLYAYMEAISSSLDTERLAFAIHSSLLQGTLSTIEAERRLNLLAHVIDMMGLQRLSYQHIDVLWALGALLSTLVTDIKLRLTVDDGTNNREVSGIRSSSDQFSRSLSPYVKSKLLLLVRQDYLSNFFNVFSIANSQPSSRDGLELAEFVLTLLRCFPGHGDEMRMLFLQPICSNEGSETSSIKLLWQSVFKTSLFTDAMSDSDSPISILQRYLRPEVDTIRSSNESKEWNMLLLFLDLYTFVLRISDDEDFLSGMEPQVTGNQLPSNRLRSCSLSRPDVTHLSLFLKALSFPLYYDTAKVLPDTKGRHDNAAPSISGRSGGSSDRRLDFGSLREIISTATRMLYERDSRRHFLPQDHWLMTSKFSMDGFIDDVVAEEQRQREMDSDGEEETDVEADHLEKELNRVEKLIRLQNKMRREMKLAKIGPKLEILRNMPYIIPFDTRVKIFRRFVHNDKIWRRSGSADADLWRLRHHTDQKHRAKVRRESIFDDAYEQFWALGDGLKEPIQIKFIDQFGGEEQGIDGGGVTKEFLTCITNEAFGQRHGVVPFVANQQGNLYPNPSALDEQADCFRQLGLGTDSEEVLREKAELLQRYEFLGRIVGKCMYEGILIDISFANFFLLKWTALGQSGENLYRGSLNDLRDMDEEMYQGLLHLKNYTGNVQDLGLDFTIDDKISLPDEPLRTITRPLVVDGASTAVTNDNRLLYIWYVAKHRLVSQQAGQTAYFLRGLRAIIHPQWLSMFNQSELQRLVGGDSLAIDLEDLRRNTVYMGLYETPDGTEHPTIRLFWEVMGDFSDAERRNVVKYVTSTPRAPLLGFSLLHPKFTIRDAGFDDTRLPSASTCVNLLKLPIYRTKQVLRNKLLLAITSGAGFDLS